MRQMIVIFAIVVVMLSVLIGLISEMRGGVRGYCIQIGEYSCSVATIGEER